MCWWWWWWGGGGLRELVVGGGGYLLPNRQCTRELMVTLPGRLHRSHSRGQSEGGEGVLGTGRALIQSPLHPKWGGWVGGWVGGCGSPLGDTHWSVLPLTPPPPPTVPHYSHRHRHRLYSATFDWIDVWFWVWINGTIVSNLRLFI